jgi:predicted transglutaminase-like cysteine proteinase
VEEFADPWTVLQRGWGDCDDLVIYRGAELIANGYPCHAQVVRNTKLNKYHTQLRRDFGPSGVVEDPCLKLMGRPLEQWLIRSS